MPQFEAQLQRCDNLCDAGEVPHPLVVATSVTGHNCVALVVAKRYRATAPVAALAGFKNSRACRMVVAFGLLEKSNKDGDFGLVFDLDVCTHNDDYSQEKTVVIGLVVE